MPNGRESQPASAVPIVGRGVGLSNEVELGKVAAAMATDRGAEPLTGELRCSIGAFGARAG